MVGIDFTKLPRYKDPRGSLTVLEKGEPLPFDIHRVFIINDVPESAIRAGHAISSHIALTPMAGRVMVDLDNGIEQTTFALSQKDQALCIHAGIHLLLRDFSPSTILLVAASETYTNTKYFDSPQPQFLKNIKTGQWTRFPFAPLGCESIVLPSLLK